MAGAIAGTAILKNLSLSNKLKVITLTINNNCNLNCPHCYLQYDKENFLVTDLTLESIFKSEFDHLAIVGKEPFVSSTSVELFQNIVEKCSRFGKSVSVITNGVGLNKLSSNTMQNIDYIDVSFDGGPSTYRSYRKGSFDKIINNISNIQSKSNVTFNALNTINSETISYIDDMMKVANFCDFKTIMFSPYLKTWNHGINNVSVVALETILSQLSQSRRFMESGASVLLIDKYHINQEGISDEFLINLVSTYKIEDKVKFIDQDPIKYGIIRVTFDDYVLTPHESIHPKQYDRSDFLASTANLNEVFAKMLTYS